MFHLLRCILTLTSSSLLIVLPLSLVAAEEQTTIVYPDSRSHLIQDKHQISWSDFKFAAKKGKLSGTYRFSEGTYDVSSTVYIFPQDSNITLRGGPDVLFTGRYTDKNATAIAGGFSLNASNVVFDNFHFSNTSSCIRARKNSKVNNIVIRNLTAKNTHSCILIERNSNIQAANWSLKKISIYNYYRSGIRIAGPQTHNFSLDNFLIDGERASTSHCYKGGIQILAQAYDIHLSNGEIKNNIGSCKKYKQGDGIEIDDKQGVPHHIFIDNVVVSNSADANLDLKAEHVSMTSVTSKSNIKTKSGFKLWTYDSYSCKKCDIQGNYEAMLRIIAAKTSFTWSDPSIPQSKNYRLYYHSPKGKPVWQ